MTDQHWEQLMPPMECVIRAQIKIACWGLLGRGASRDALGLAIAQSIGTLIPLIQESSDLHASELMSAIRSSAARHLCSRPPSRQHEAHAFSAFSALPGSIDEDEVSAAFGAIQDIVESSIEGDSDGDPLDYSMLADALVEAIADLDLTWLTTARLCMLVARSRETDELIADADDLDPEPSWLN